MRSRSFSKSSIVSWISPRLASGHELNSSGGTTWPLRAGASAKPSGVRRMTMFFSAALSRRAENASACLAWNAWSMAPRRVW